MSRSDVLLPLLYIVGFGGCTLLVLYVLFVTVAPPPAPPPPQIPPGDYQLTEGKVLFFLLTSVEMEIYSS